MEDNSTTALAMTAQMPTQPNALQIAHLVFLFLICVIGTIGNIMTIIAVKIERKLRESLANMFIVNLAIADLIVCATVVPMLIAHDAHAEMLFGPVLCYITVSVSGIACHTAAATMTCIAVTRYIAASRATRYHNIVTKKRVYLAITCVWSFAAINSVPILIAWLMVDYDVTKYVCVCFDGTFPLYYTLGPVFIGHFLPHAVTIYCYFCIMKAMRQSRKRLTSSTGTTNDTVGSVSAVTDKRKSTIVNSESETGEQKVTLSVSNWSKHEIQLFKTSMWIIGFFSFCWIPYGILVLLQELAPIELKKTFASLCLLSFSLNPVLYGMLSRSFRKAYHRIVRKVFCNFGEGSDSLYYNTTSRESTSGIQLESQRSPRRKQYQVKEESSIQYGRSAPE